MTDNVLINLCRKAWGESTASKIAAFNAIQEWLNDNKDNKDLLQRAANYTDNFYYGRTPLYYLVAARSPPDLVERLILLAPDTLKVLDRFCGFLPLHYAIEYEAAPDVVKMLLEAYPEATQIQNNDGRLPLHIACYRGACLEVLHLLSEADPASIDLLDHKNNKPSYYLKQWARLYDDCQGNNDHIDLLNNAVINGFSVYLVKLLLEVLPGQCMTRDGNGMTLLHHACENAAAAGSLEVVMTLLEVNPETSTIVDNHGRTPSHLLQQVASQRNENGMYPLHRHAAGGLLTVKSLRLLFNAHPESIALPDNHGMLPFHHAALNNAYSLDVLKLFVTLYPESILFNF